MIELDSSFTEGRLWISVAVGLMIFYSIPLYRLLLILRDDHPGVYEEVGSPWFFWRSSFSSSWKFGRFLFSSRPRRLNDPRVLFLCRIIRVIGIPLVIWVVSPFLLILWFAIIPPS